MTSRVGRSDLGEKGQDVQIVSSMDTQAPIKRIHKTEVTMPRSFLVGLVAALILFVGARVSVARFQGEASKAEARQAELADASPIRVGEMTPKLEFHSRRFPDYARICARQTLLSAMRKSPGEDIRRTHTIGLHSDEEPEYAQDVLRELLSQSDTVLRGRVVGKQSQLTDDLCWVFTDYEVRINEVLKNNRAAPVDAGGLVTVTKPGGSVIIDSTLVVTLDEAVLPLPRGKSEVLLFLKYIPETGSYESVPGFASFELNTATMKPLCARPAPRSLPTDRLLFERMLVSTIDRVTP